MRLWYASRTEKLRSITHLLAPFCRTIQFCHMPSSTPADRSTALSIPSNRDLDRLASAIRSAGHKQGLPNRIIDRYEAWIYTFLSWSLHAPPNRVDRDRIGDFWTALTQREVQTWKVCEAMDALGFLFGTLGGPEALFLSQGPAADGDGQEQDTLVTRRLVHRPNPTLRLSSDDAATGTKDHDENLSSYLPEGRLPEGIDARATIPTRETQTPKREAPSDTPSVKTPSSATPSSSHEQTEPTTLFNPKGTVPPPENDRGSKESETAPNRVTENASAKRGPVDDRSKREKSAGETGAQSAAHAQASQQDGRRSEQEQETVSLQIPKAVADRVQEAAHQLGLPATVFVARALELVCSDAGIVAPNSEDSPESPLRQYQAQIDLLHFREDEQSDDAPDPDTSSERRRPAEKSREAERRPPFKGTSPSEKTPTNDAEAQADPSTEIDSEKYETGDEHETRPRARSDNRASTCDQPVGNGRVPTGSDPSEGDGHVGDNPRLSL